MIESKEEIEKATNKWLGEELKWVVLDREYEEERDILNEASRRLLSEGDGAREALEKLNDLEDHLGQDDDPGACQICNGDIYPYADNFPSKHQDYCQFSILQKHLAALASQAPAQTEDDDG